MNTRTMLHRPGRTAAVVAVAGLLFAACGSASGSESTHARDTKPHQEITAATTADVDTLWGYLNTLTPAERNQTIVALNPNVRGALEAIIAGEVATANTH